MRKVFFYTTLLMLIFLLTEKMGKREMHTCVINTRKYTHAT